MNLHVFNDSHGFFLNLTVERFKENNALENNSFINLTNNTIYTHSQVTYLKRNLPSFKRAVKNIPVITTITFYPLDHTSVFFLQEVKKKYPAVKTSWVFWGYEFYHRPYMNQLNFEAFSAAWYKRQNGVFEQIKNACINLLKKILQIPVFNTTLLQESYAQVNKFYSFLPQDFKNVFATQENTQCEYYPISFLSIDEMKQDIAWGGITSEVMVGHAASPSINHAEMLQQLKAISFSGKLFIPLEYGEKGYGAAIKSLANDLFPNNTEFLEQRLSMQAYYQRLSVIGFAIFNFRWQEALGNIVFLTWNGTKIFLQQESSVYKQFAAWGITVFSIEQDLDRKSIIQLLTAEEQQKNKTIIEGLFAEQKVKQYWAALMKD